jgi:hypothetical protein
MFSALQHAGAGAGSEAIRVGDAASNATAIANNNLLTLIVPPVALILARFLTK